MLANRCRCHGPRPSAANGGEDGGCRATTRMVGRCIDDLGAEVGSDQCAPAPALARRLHRGEVGGGSDEVRRRSAEGAGSPSHDRTGAADGLTAHRAEHGRARPAHQERWSRCRNSGCVQHYEGERRALDETSDVREHDKGRKEDDRGQSSAWQPTHAVLGVWPKSTKRETSMDNLKVLWTCSGSDPQARADASCASSVVPHRQDASRGGALNHGGLEAP